MSDELARARRFFAEEIQAVANLRTPGLVDALASVPRERFLGPGPWIVRSDADFGMPPRQTPDADPRRVYHNYSVGLDPVRQLFNGQPSLIAMLIDTLALAQGARVLHIGCGAGYYTALMARVVGPEGRVAAIEVDAALASAATAHLRDWPWTEVRHGNGTAIGGEGFDAILVHAGVTHPLDAWLDALEPQGRLIFPLTATSAEMGPIGKGVVVLLSKNAGGFAARAVTFVAIYSAIGVRDDALNDLLGAALRRTPFPRLSRYRRDGHEKADACWWHFGRGCLS